MIKLVISDNEGTTTVVPLVRDEVSIGRKEGNTIRLTERNISREHCQLQRHNGSFLVRDLRSYNGVLLNGQRVVGQSELKPGDELRIGDYTLLLEAEARQAVDATETEPTRVTPVPRTPPRLVVLNAPLAGAEFSLPEHGELRIGRAPDLDIALDHRSVSREHARIVCAPGQVRIIDSGSINGIVVNRQKQSEAQLSPGDVIELGDVLLRFVGPGEQYVFDPGEVRTLLAPRGKGLPKQSLLAAAVISVAALLALLIVRSGSKPSAAPPASQAPPAATAAAPVPVAAPAPAPQPTPADQFAELLSSCQQANEGGRYAEAVAHANAALKVRPDAAEALACRDTARVNNEQEQIYVRAKAALEAGDAEGAWKELSSLSAGSAVAARPEVVAALTDAARSRLAAAQSGLRKHPEQAAELAGGVLAVELVPADMRAQARAIVDRATSARAPKLVKAELKPRSAPAAEPRPKPAPAPHPASGGSPIAAASACLARGDNACVIRALNGKAQTAQELGLLIETYRAVGESAQAYRNMAVYVQRFPTARRAEVYREMLERQGH